MRDIIENKEIKVNERNIIPLAEIKEESDVTLNLELYKNNIPFDVTGQSIKLGLLINNELIGEQTDGITINKNVVTIKLKNNFIQPGKLELDLTLTDNTGRMTTSSFYLIVNKKTIGGTSIQGTDLLETLDKVILYFKVNSQKAIDGFIAESTELLSDIKKNGEKTINDIKKNYDSLKQIIIDENQAANLQEQININKNKIDRLEELAPIWKEYDGIENITVNDSFEGVTKDLVVRGRTLNNLTTTKYFKMMKSNRGAVPISTGEMIEPSTPYTIIFDVTGINKGNLNDFSINGKDFDVIESDVIRIGSIGKYLIKIRTNSTFSYNGKIIIKGLSQDWLTDDLFIEFRNFILLKGDFTQTPPSTYFDSITSVGEQEDNKIKIKSVGKNLCRFNRISTTPVGAGWINLDGSYSSLGTGNETVINILKAGTYSMSAELGSNVTNIQLMNPNNYNEWVGTGKSTSNLSAGKYVLRIKVIEGNKLATVDNIILNEGSVATNYEPYVEDSKTIKLPFDGGLKSLPNGISDEIYDNGKIIQKIEKRIYKPGDELLPNIITDKKNTIIELSEYKTYDINPFFLRTFNETTHLYQENNICGEISFEIAKDRDAIINGNTESISKLNKISESHIEESKKKNNELQQNIDSNSVSIRGIETKIKNFVTLEELGAIGDGVANDLPALNKAMELMLQNKIKKVVGNGVYAISSSFNINNKNDITFEIDTIIPHSSFGSGGYLIDIGSNSAGSMANVNLKINLLDCKNKSSGLNIKGCGSSLFNIDTIVNANTAITMSNPPRISSDNKFTGRNIRKCGWGVIIRSENISACEGTIIDYNFIYDCKYAGILLGKGSHYTDIRSALDFNGKQCMILQLNNTSGLKRGDQLTLEGENVNISEVFGNCVLVYGDKIIDKGNTKFTKGKEVAGKTIQEVITTNSDQNVFLDIINANDKAGFSRNIITSQYCGGIYGDKNSINTDFIVSYRTGQNENVNIQGLEVATNSESVKLIEGRTGNNLFNYKSQEKVIELNNVQISGSRQNNVLPASASDHPVASIQDLLDGLYSVNVIAQGRVDYVYQGLLVKYGSSKSITKIASVNVDLKVDETDTIKATNGSGSLSPTIAIYFTRLASY